MPFGQDVLLWCLLTPALLALLAAAVARFTVSKRIVGDQSVAAAGVTSGVGWCLALLVALAARNQWQWWPAEFWQTTWWAMLAAAILLSSGATLDQEQSAGRWVAAGLLALLLAWCSLPAGEEWEDMLPLHRSWMVAIASSALLNCWAIDHVSRNGGHRWSLWIVIAGLGAPFALAATTYGALSEWSLAAITATVVFAVAAIFSSSGFCWSVAFPALFFQASMTAAARFHSYEEYRAWFYAVILLLPAATVMADLPLRARTARFRILVSATIAALLLGLCLWQIFNV